MIIVGVNKSTHNASVVLMKDNEIIFHIESERLSHNKYDGLPFEAMSKIRDYVDHVDIVALAGFTGSRPYDSTREDNVYKSYILGIHKTFYDNRKNMKVYDFGNQHHATHAAISFYNSGFDEALCVVKDGAGSEIKSKSREDRHLIGRESSSFFTAEYPENISLVKQHITTPYRLSDSQPDNWRTDVVYENNSFSEGTAYEMFAENIGLTWRDAGKVMGMSAYGKYEDIIPQIYKDNHINRDIFSFNEVLNMDRWEFNYKKIDKNNFQSLANFAYALQTQVQDHVAEEILDMLKQTNQKKLCLSGGFFLNCVSNYNLLKKLPKDVKIYVEPISSDAGTAIGAAKLAYYIQTGSKEIKKQNHIYYGPKYNYTKDDLINEKIIENINPADVAKIISEKNIVAIYQGSSEAGPRALGNRSILYDPRDPNGKDHVNTVKNREWYRPFAGSVLKENAKEWFDLVSLDESKFMMFAVDVLEDKKDLIPAITHVDGTCRVQTVAIEDNPNFYDLINEFYKITNVPILFNTSFNLAGDTIVETLKDALWTLHNSQIMFLYLPELRVLVTK
jgi:carbamoyltransferase